MKKVLLALDCSPHSRRAAEYLAEVVRHVSGCEIIFFSVMSGIPYGSRELEESSSPEVHGDEDHYQEARQVEMFFQEISDLFDEKGVAANRVEKIARPMQRGVALDIIDLALSSGCDTIVAGRRGLSKIREMIQGSVSSELVHKAPLAVWIIE